MNIRHDMFIDMGILVTGTCLKPQFMFDSVEYVLGEYSNDFNQQSIFDSLFDMNQTMIDEFALYIWLFSRRTQSAMRLAMDIMNRLNNYRRALATQLELDQCPCEETLSNIQSLINTNHAAGLLLKKYEEYGWTKTEEDTLTSLMQKLAI